MVICLSKSLRITSLYPSREIDYSLDLPEEIDCDVIVAQTLHQGIYVSNDQLNDLKKMKLVNDNFSSISFNILNLNLFQPLSRSSRTSPRTLMWNCLWKGPRHSRSICLKGQITVTFTSNYPFTCGTRLQRRKGCLNNYHHLFAYKPHLYYSTLLQFQKHSPLRAHFISELPQRLLRTKDK